MCIRDRKESVDRWIESPGCLQTAGFFMFFKCTSKYCLEFYLEKRIFMQDQFQRKIDYLRISVTDRCNLRCKYCMPVEGVEWMPHEAILSFEEILRLMKISIQLGFRRFRITGGEPLVRKGILDFLREGAKLPGVEDLSLIHISEPTRRT